MARTLTPATGRGPADIEAVAGEPGAGQQPSDLPEGHALGPDLRAHLGAQLRAMYHEIVNDPVPDRFRQLLEELAKKGRPADEQ